MTRAPATTQMQTFGIPFALPDFRHSFMSGRRLEQQPWNDEIWDFAAVRLRLVERRLLSEADVQRSPDRRLGTSEAGPVEDRQLSGRMATKRTLG